MTAVAPFRRPDWIFFDLDDTLWDFEANSLISLKLLYEEESVLQCIFPDFESFSEKYHAINSALWRQYQNGEIERGFLLNERFRATISNQSDTLESNQHILGLADKLNWSYLDKLGEQTKLVEGAEEVLRHVGKSHLTGILSNGFKEVQYKKLFNSGLDRFIQRTVLSDETGIPKPDRRIFDYALSATGARRENAIMIGDNPESDIAGALQAGWKAIYFDRHKRVDAPEGTTAVITSLSELTKLI